MYKIINNEVYKIDEIQTNSGIATIKINLGNETIQEEIKNEQDEVIETISKKFNLETGEYEVV